MRVGSGGRAVGAMRGRRSARAFREYRRDVVLDVRQIDVALRGLRRLGREGAIEELDLDETIERTGKNAGELGRSYFGPPRRNRVKVLLLMDVGVSMDPHSELMSRLVTAASRSRRRFAKFRSYYFHNCVYSNGLRGRAGCARRAPPSCRSCSATSAIAQDEKLWSMVVDALLASGRAARSGAEGSRCIFLFRTVARVRHRVATPASQQLLLQRRVAPTGCPSGYWER